MFTADIGLEKAYQYQEDILSGKITACNYVKQAVKRHQTDLKEAHNRGLFFCEDTAWRALKMFEFLKHSKGDLSGKLIDLEPWQCFIITCVFGWLNEETKTRRFKTVYEEVARKNAKSTKLAGIGLYGLTKDSEGGPEIYTAATKKEQARIMFEVAQNMVMQSPALNRRLDLQKHVIYNRANFGKFLALSSDAQTLDGLNPHFALVDEFHAHKNSEVWDVLISALGARSQPLIWAVTTAGNSVDCICYAIRDYAIKVLNGIVQDDAFFGIIYTLDEGDDWRDPAVWIKSNPNLGVSVKEKELKELLSQALEMPMAKINFLIKRLNVWVTSSALWCNVERWKKCKVEFNIQELADNAVEVYLGVDLSTVEDIASIGGIAIMPDGKWRVFGRHYLPEDSVHSKIRKTVVPFMAWYEQGFLILTPGNIIDYDWIKSDLFKLKEIFGSKLKSISFDRWNSSQLVNDLLKEDMPMVPVGMGYASMNAPMRELERRYLSGQLEHNGDPVMSWAMSNVVVKQDEAGNIKPDKAKSSEKIDQVVAILLAGNRAILFEKEEEVVDTGCEIWN